MKIVYGDPNEENNKKTNSKTQNNKKTNNNNNNRKPSNLFGDDSDEELFSFKKVDLVLNQIESSRFSIADMDCIFLVFSFSHLSLSPLSLTRSFF
jgi:hypothetical protein